MPTITFEEIMGLTHAIKIVSDSSNAALLEENEYGRRKLDKVLDYLKRLQVEMAITYFERL